MKYNWNSTRKTKKKTFLGFILQDITPWNHKNVRNCYFCGYFRDLGSNVKFHGFLWFCEFLKVSASIFCLKTVLTLNSVFSLILNIYQGVLSEKTFYIKITIVPGDIGTKKSRKASHKLKIKNCSQCLIMNSSLLLVFMVQKVFKNSFSGGKNRRNSIPVTKISFSLQKIHQTYRFPWVNTKTIKYTCKFNTS